MKREHKVHRGGSVLRSLTARSSSSGKSWFTHRASQGGQIHFIKREVHLSPSHRIRSTSTLLPCRVAEHSRQEAVRRRRHRAAQSRGDRMVHPTSIGARRGEPPPPLRFYQLSMSEEKLLLEEGWRGRVRLRDRDAEKERERARRDGWIIRATGGAKLQKLKETSLKASLNPEFK